MMKHLTKNIDLFKLDHEFYGEIELLLTVKSFTLQKIRARYLESRKNHSGTIGSVERRETDVGGIVRIKICEGKIIDEEILCYINEPRGIQLTDNILGIASENKVHIFKGNNQYFTITNKWFSYIHTIDFFKNKLLVSSSGFDCIFEYDLENQQKTMEWFAWEHGFNMGKNAEGETQFLTRSKEFEKTLSSQGKNVLLIEDPKNTPLPTAQRAAFINSVYYKDKTSFLATFFHEGKVYCISPQNNTVELIFEGLKSPHGGRPLEHNKYMVTNTAGGNVQMKENNITTIYDFCNLRGKPNELKDLEWIQNSINYGDCFISVDSNRTAFVIFDRKKEKIDVINYNRDWAIQDLVIWKDNKRLAQKIKGLN